MWNSSRREPGVEPDGLGDPAALEDDLGAQRVLVDPSEPPAGGDVLARLEVRRVDVPRVPGGGLVLVELEPVGGRGERLAAAGDEAT